MVLNIQDRGKRIASGLARRCLSDEAYVKLKYRFRFGKRLNLENPQTFNEKLNWIIARHYDPNYEICADKLAVRNYVREKGLGNCLTEVYEVFDNVSAVNFNQLPNSFVIKTNHSFGGVFVVKDKNSANFNEITTGLRRSFNSNPYKKGGEWQYKNIKPKIFAEEYLDSGDSPLLDFKFYCFDGVPRFIHVSEDIAGGGSYVMDFYSPDWDHLEARRVGKLRSEGISKPKNLEEMLQVAATLSQDFAHVRVDLYSIRGRIVVGELTFTTAAGTGRFTDEKWDLEFGKYFQLPKID